MRRTSRAMVGCLPLFCRAAPGKDPPPNRKPGSNFPAGSANALLPAGMTRIYVQIASRSRRGSHAGRSDLPGERGGVQQIKSFILLQLHFSSGFLFGAAAAASEISIDPAGSNNPWWKQACWSQVLEERYRLDWSGVNENFGRWRPCNHLNSAIQL